MKTNGQNDPTLKRGRHTKGWVWRRLREGWAGSPTVNPMPSGRCLPAAWLSARFRGGRFSPPVVCSFWRPRFPSGPSWFAGPVFPPGPLGLPVLAVWRPRFPSGPAGFGVPPGPSPVAVSARIPGWDSSAVLRFGFSEPLGFSSPPRLGAQCARFGRRSCVAFRFAFGVFGHSGAPGLRCDVGSSDSSPVRFYAGVALAARWCFTPTRVPISSRFRFLGFLITQGPPR